MVWTCDQRHVTVITWKSEKREPKDHDSLWLLSFTGWCPRIHRIGLHRMAWSESWRLGETTMPRWLDVISFAMSVVKRACYATRHLTCTNPRKCWGESKQCVMHRLMRGGKNIFGKKNPRSWTIMRKEKNVKVFSFGTRSWTLCIVNIVSMVVPIQLRDIGIGLNMMDWEECYFILMHHFLLFVQVNAKYCYIWVQQQLGRRVES